MRHLAPRRSLAPLLLLPLFLPGAARAQQGALLSLTVTAAVTRQPLPAATVQVLGSGLHGVTDGSGRLRMAGLPLGPATVEIRHPGYATLRVAVEIQRGRHTEVAAALQPQPVELEEVRVRGREGARVGSAAEFDARRRRGVGRFIDRDEIDRTRPRRFSDLLRSVPGMDLSCSASEEVCRAASSSAAASLSHDFSPVSEHLVNVSCPVQYFVDGAYHPFPDVNLIRPEDVEAVEIYAHGHDAPARYSMRKSSRCGVVLVWMRADLR